jgi:holliday junction DNA helicase RuvA
MFAFLRGTVARKGADHVELDVGGVGFEVFVPEVVQRRLAVHQEATLLTYCHIREDAFQIFGFLREEEKALFRMLLGISGIGPKVSLAILSAMSVAEFGRAILENDVTAFTRVSGVGKKTAQRVVLEMKAKMGQDTELSAILGEREETATADSDDVIAALCSLGCSLAEARKAAATARKQAGADASAEELVKAALRSLPSWLTS